MSNKAHIIYLDQNHWISLAQAAVSHVSGIKYLDIYNKLKTKVNSGEIIIPLSLTHYMETGYIHDPRKRNDIGRTMAELSLFRTLIHKATVQRSELETALSKVYGLSYKSKEMEKIGFGVSFTTTGISRILELKGNTDQLEYSLGGKDKLNEWLYDKIVFMEMSCLAGLPEDWEQDLLNNQKYNYNPEAYKVVCDKRAKQEQDLADKIAQDPSLKSKIHECVYAIYLAYEILEDITILLLEKNMTTTNLIPFGKEKLNDLVMNTPTADVATSLLIANHKNLNRPWIRNDIYDIDGLSIAVPYCDIVVTEKHASRQLNNAKLGQKYNTKIISKLEDLMELL